MSKYQDALDNVRKFEREHNMSKFGDVVPQPNSDTLQELVDKEIPMKVKYLSDDFLSEPYNVKCPYCDYILGKNFIPTNEREKTYHQYCCRCGQKLDWSDECE